MKEHGELFADGTEKQVLYYTESEYKTRILPEEFDENWLCGLREVVTNFEHVIVSYKKPILVGFPVSGHYKIYLKSLGMYLALAIPFKEAACYNVRQEDLSCVLHINKKFLLKQNIFKEGWKFV